MFLRYIKSSILQRTSSNACHSHPDVSKLYQLNISTIQLVLLSHLDVHCFQHHQCLYSQVRSQSPHSIYKSQIDLSVILQLINNVKIIYLIKNMCDVVISSEISQLTTCQIAMRYFLPFQKIDSEPLLLIRTIFYIFTLQKHLRRV